MKIFVKMNAALIVLLSLIACDIEPISVGSWEIQIETAAGIEAGVWTITADGTMTMAGEPVTVVEGLVLEGSRIAWTLESENPEEAGQMMTTNFSGTVDGRRLSGTLFTPLGNSSVNGSLREAD